LIHISPKQSRRVIYRPDYGYSSASWPVSPSRDGALWENCPMRLTARGGAWLAFAGLAVVLVGTFLPWLRSGDTLRDSYQSIDVLRVQPTPPDGPVGVLLYAWLTLIPLCSISIALYALRLRRAAALVACLVAVLAAVTSVLAVLHLGGPTDPIGFSPTGPIVTLMGAAAALIGGIVVLRGPLPRLAEAGQSGVEP
jgi:hypothetical protein